MKENIQLQDRIIPVGERTCIMGILNVTPDSFSDGGKYIDPERAVEHAVRMVESGTDIIDIGGESSRPGSQPVTAEEELKRVMPVVKALKNSIGVPLSIDTCKSEVAREALWEGVSIVNDITALRQDPDMAETIAEFDAGVVLMHMKGKPRTMQENPLYDDLMDEICSYLSGSIDIALRAGMDPDKIIIDPGIGFGKRVEDNLMILKRLDRLEDLGKPVLVGTSRKSFIGRLTGKDPEERSFGTVASCAIAVMNGASILRVHDVAEVRDAIKIVDAVKGV